MSNRRAHNLEAKWRSADVITDRGIDFSSLNLDGRILSGLSKAGYEKPTPVQLEAIPKCLSGADVFVQGKAGTGKDLIFAISALTAVLEAEDLQVLILAQTREGAFQIYSTICTIGSEIRDLKCDCFIGGFDYEEDVSKADDCQIAVGTPGRILRLIFDGKLGIDTINLFIIDDFDELLNDDLKPDITKIITTLPEEKQTVFASLICTEEVLNLATKFLKDPFLSIFNQEELSLLGMAHYYCILPVPNLMYMLSYRKKLEVLKSVLKKVKFSQCIIFCNTVSRVDILSIDIRSCGFSVVSMSKAIDQVERLRAVELLKQNKCKVLVSTDVVAKLHDYYLSFLEHIGNLPKKCSRGLDAENVDLVINYDIPSRFGVYLHRCGRAGRFGAKCSSITFLLKNETDEFDKIENEGRFNSYALPKPIPEDLHCDINPSAVPILPLLIANENGETGFEGVDESSSVIIANKIEELPFNSKTVNTTHPGDFEMIKQENECSEVDHDTAKIKGSEAFSNVSESLESNNKPYKDSVTVSSECESLPLNDGVESSDGEISDIDSLNSSTSSDGEIADIDSLTSSTSSDGEISDIDSLTSSTSSDGEISDIETKRLKETDTGNEYSSYEEIDMCSSSKKKRTIKIKSTSKISEKYVLHKIFDRKDLEREESKKNISKFHK